MRKVYLQYVEGTHELLAVIVDPDAETSMKMRKATEEDVRDSVGNVVFDNSATCEMFMAMARESKDAE